MSYFISHMIPIFVATLIIAAVCFITVLAANRSKELDEEQKDDYALQCKKESCKGCGGCKMFDFSTRPVDPEEPTR